MNNNKKQWFYYLLSTTAAILILIAYKTIVSHFHKEEKAEAQLKLAIVSASPYKTSVKQYVEAVGQCTASASIALVPQVEGELVNVLRSNGGHVNQGDRLFEIDNRTYTANLKQAQAQLAIDQAQLHLSQSQLQRSEALRTGDFVSQQEYDGYKANVETYEGHVKLDEANCTLKTIDLDHCTINAPFSGELGKASVDAHSFVAKGTALATLNQMQPIYTDFSLSEKHFQVLQKASSTHLDNIVVEARLLDNPSVTQSGKLVSIGNSIDKTTGSFDVRAEFKNENNQFWAGRAVDVKIYYESLNDVFLVPEGAIHLVNNGHFIYIINHNNEAEMLDVTKGQSYNGWVVIHTGLKGDEKIIAEGHPLLAPGVQVVIASTLEAPQQLNAF